MIPGGIMAPSKFWMIASRPSRPSSSTSSFSSWGGVFVSSSPAPSPSAGLGRVGPYYSHLDVHPSSLRRRVFASSRQNNTNVENVGNATENDVDDVELTSDDDVDDMANEQSRLHREATYLTRTLYRRCLKSIRLLAVGNDRDEKDFAEREADEREDRLPSSDEDGRRRRVSMAPPVNRVNELRSRADYYRAFARENFDGHFGLLGAHGFHIGDDEGGSSPPGGHGMVARGDDADGRGWNQYWGGHHHLGVQMSTQFQVGGGGGGGGGGGRGNMINLAAGGGGGHYMWREEQIEKFVYLIRSGEEKRRWIMNDYEFEDDAQYVMTTATMDDDDGVTPPRGWPLELERRLSAFEVQSRSLVKRMYHGEGWIHSTDRTERGADDNSGFFSDSDSDNDDVDDVR